MTFAQNDDGVVRLKKEVGHELVMLPYLGVFDNLTYRVDGRNVTLSGQVTRLVLKDDASRAVERIEGVGKVDNQIKVLPLSPNDDDLRRSLFRAIYEFGPLSRYALAALNPIRIVVNNGNVTLEGIVYSDADKNLAGIRANGVHGVSSVSNNLQVEKRTVGFVPRFLRNLKGRSERLPVGDEHGQAFAASLACTASDFGFPWKVDRDNTCVSEEQLDTLSSCCR